MTRTVVFAQRHMVHFRVPVYEKLREALGKHGVRVRVLVGDPSSDEAAKTDAGRLSWSEHRRRRYYLGETVCWMPTRANPGTVACWCWHRRTVSCSTTGNCCGRGAATADMPAERITVDMPTTPSTRDR